MNSGPLKAVFGVALLLAALLAGCREVRREVVVLDRSFVARWVGASLEEIRVMAEKSFEDPAA